MSEKWGRIPTMKDYPIDPCDRAECAELKSRLAEKEKVIRSNEMAWVRNHALFAKLQAQERAIERYREALETIVKHESIQGWDQNPMATIYGLVKSALQEGEGGK